MVSFINSFAGLEHLELVCKCSPTSFNLANELDDDLLTIRYPSLRCLVLALQPTTLTKLAVEVDSISGRLVWKRDDGNGKFERQKL